MGRVEPGFNLHRPTATLDAAVHHGPRALDGELYPQDRALHQFPFQLNSSIVYIERCGLSAVRLAHPVTRLGAMLQSATHPFRILASSHVLSKRFSSDLALRTFIDTWQNGAEHRLDVRNKTAQLGLVMGLGLGPAYACQTKLVLARESIKLS